MNIKRTVRELLSLILAAALFLCPNLTALAAELPPATTTATMPEETAPETTAATMPEETAPETTAATIPEETVPETTAATIPEETVPETTAATIPEETVPETTAATMPEETVPETTAATVPVETVSSLITVDTQTSSASAMASVAGTAPCTIAEVRAMNSGTTDIITQGTVVFVMGTQAVLQDATGGIRLSFPDTPDIALGDLLLVTGKRSGGLSVSACSVTGTGQLPAVKTTLLDAGEEIRLHIENAILGDGELKQNGVIHSLMADLPNSLAPGDRVDAYGVILDGWFYADRVTAAAQPEEAPEAGEWNVYFGQLHAHTAASDGAGSASQAYEAAKQAGLDFFAVTDHSNSFDNADSGAIGTDGSSLSTEWAEGRAAAQAATDETFVALYGYEMTWGEDLAIGHINTFRTPGWQAREQPGFDSLARYCDALSTVPGSISQFNHPCPEYGDFGRFRNYDPAQDKVMQLIEAGSEFGRTAYDSYTEALDQGWHLAPTNSEVTHDGTFASGSVRTAVLAKSLTEESLYEAMAQHRVYATEDSDLEIMYTMNGQVMGSILPKADTLTIEVFLSDPTDAAIGTVEVITQGGAATASQMVSDAKTVLTMTVRPGSPYYYLRITQPDGDTAVTAPIWVDAFDQLGIEDFTVDFPQPEPGQEVALRLDLFNDETADFLLDSLTLIHNDTVIYSADAPGSVPGLSSRSFTVPYLCETAGQITITARVTGTIAGLSRSREKTLILQGQPGDVALSTIAATRSGLLGEAYRVKGYVTAGTSNPYNTFPDTLYVQDDTGGIAVVDFTDTGIQVGTPIEVAGILRRLDGNLVLGLTDYTLPGEAHYRCVPRTMTHETAMNYDAHGGELLQIEGKVVSLRKTADGKGISRFTLQDIRGDLATVVIEDSIASGAYGTNALASQIKKGRTVRAMGLLHIDEFGKTVLRVRNCEEVVYVPPKTDPTNPKTGDLFLLWK